MQSQNKQHTTSVIEHDEQHIRLPEHILEHVKEDGMDTTEAYNLLAPLIRESSNKGLVEEGHNPHLDVVYVSPDGWMAACDAFSLAILKTEPTDLSLPLGLPTLKDLHKGDTATVHSGGVEVECDHKYDNSGFFSGIENHPYADITELLWEPGELDQRETEGTSDVRVDLSLMQRVGGIISKKFTRVYLPADEAQDSICMVGDRGVGLIMPVRR